MMGRLVLFLCLLLAGLAPGQMLDLDQPPERGIWDPEEFLDETYRRNIEARIENEKDTKEFEMFVVFFLEEPPGGAAQLAKQAGEKWSKGQYWAVIYQVGAEGMPECVAGGKLVGVLRPDVVEDRIRGATRMASLVSTRQERMEEMVNSIATRLGFLKKEAELEEAAARKQAIDDYHRAKEAKIRRAILGVLGGGFLLLLGGGGFFLYRKSRQATRTLYFPRTNPRTRLMAPHSGGGNVQVAFGQRRQR